MYLIFTSVHSAENRRIPFNLIRFLESDMQYKCAYHVPSDI